VQPAERELDDAARRRIEPLRVVDGDDDLAPGRQLSQQ
jgi:hypothetical protein